LRAGYFDARTAPGLSLLELGAELGYTMLAIDRPGYGRSARWAPAGLTLAEQAATVRAALAGYAEAHPAGAGYFLVGHSYGGKLALTLAADWPDLLGLDISGCGELPAMDIARPASSPDSRMRRLNWGPPGLYPPGTFQFARSLIAPMPVSELAGALTWPSTFPLVAARIRPPVRFTFAQHERLWRHDDEAIASLRRRLAAAARVLVDRQPGAGHNISLSLAARAYHLRVLAFAGECLSPRTR
jgi:pimeloyl-ACP methyl ester carboxylesterase